MVEISQSLAHLTHQNVGEVVLALAVVMATTTGSSLVHQRLVKGDAFQVQ